MSELTFEQRQDLAGKVAALRDEIDEFCREYNIEQSAVWRYLAEVAAGFSAT